MALEQEIAALRDEMQKLTAVTTKLLEVRTEAIETVRSAAAPAAAKASAKKESDKPAPVAETKAEPKAAESKADPKPTAAAETKAEPAAVPADDDLSDDGLKAHVAAYVNYGSTDEEPITTDERGARMEKVRGVLDHEKIKAKTVAEVPQNARKAFRKKINEFIAEIETNGPLTGAGSTGDELDGL